MAHYRHPRRKDRKSRAGDGELVERVRGHLGSRPRGNPEVDRGDYERARDRLERVLGR